jgi:hypothetical protein
LQPGQGLICNNVLHDRSGFDDDGEHKRQLYRLRYYQRILQDEMNSSNGFWSSPPAKF